MAGTIVASTLSDGTNSTSTTNCIQGSAKAWVNFNGTTSPGTIRASYNVSSVTRNGTGDYTVNFTNAFSDANYTQVASASPNYSVSYGAGVALNHGLTNTEFAPTTTSCRFETAGINTSSYNAKYIYVAIFR